MRNGLFVFLAMGLPLLGEEFDSRLSIHSIVREDVFAGFLDSDLERLAQGEKKINALLEQRPKSRAELLAWKAGTNIYRAVRAHEAKQPEEFKRHYANAMDLFGQAAKSGMTVGLAAVQGGTYVTLADRLPEPERAAAWKDAYDAYRMLYELQKKGVDNFPLHIKGELLAGLAMSAQRAGKAEEATQWTEKILASMPDTPYAARALTWKTKPELAGRTGLACQTCHEPGRLAARQAALAQAR